MPSKQDTLFKKYIDFELMNGRAPHSVYEFCKSYKLNEGTFYKKFNSLNHLRKKIISSFAEETISKLNDDSSYASFTAREKLLAVFYTLFEEFKPQRSYLIHRYSSVSNAHQLTPDWELFMMQLTDFIDGIIKEAKTNQEIPDRMFIGDYYAKGYKLVFVYLFRVWIFDESNDFETTDAAIEKTVNLTFQMLGHGTFDSLIDFGKFAIKTKVV